MTYILSFLFVGLICLIGQLILDNTKLTAGHVTSLFVVIGSFLGFCGIYEKIQCLAGAGSSIPIMSFGNLLYKAGIQGYIYNGFLGVFQNLLTTTSAGISAAIIFAFLLTIVFKPHD